MRENAAHPAAFLRKERFGMKSVTLTVYGLRRGYSLSKQMVILCFMRYNTKLDCTSLNC